MTDSPQQRHAALAEEIRRHDRAYYVEAQPTISDRDYDKLYRELLDLELAQPQLRTADSPSQRVGGVPIDGFETVRHAMPMMSLDNTYSQEEVREFVGRVLTPRGDAVDTLSELKASGYRVGLISNCSEEISSLWPATPFARLMDASVLSCDLGAVVNNRSR